MRRPFLTVFLLVLTVFPAAHAQRAAHRMASPLDIDVRAEGPIAVPFRLSNNHLVFTAKVDDQPVELVLDTGMPMNGLLLFDNDKVGQLGLEFSPNLALIGGAGGEGSMEARLASGVTVDIGPVRINDAMVVVPPKLPAFDNYVDGIIGASLFFRFIVHIDYDRSVLELHEPDAYRAPRGAATWPIELHGRMPFARIGMTDSNGETTSLKVVIDLGASHAISLNERPAGGVRAPARTIDTVLGHGLSGPIGGRVGRIPRLEFGGFTLSDVVATFPEDEHQRPGGMDSRDGNLGSGILKRFNVTFDYEGKRVLLTPNKGFGKPFEWDMSGMRLTPYGTSMRVEAIVKRSPAARAGLLVDDVITHVDGNPVGVRDAETVRLLMLREGETVEVTAERDGESLTVALVLKRLV